MRNYLDAVSILNTFVLKWFHILLFNSKFKFHQFHQELRKLVREKTLALNFGAMMILEDPTLGTVNTAYRHERHHVFTHGETVQFDLSEIIWRVNRPVRFPWDFWCPNQIFLRPHYDAVSMTSWGARQGGQGMFSEQTWQRGAGTDFFSLKVHVYRK